MATRPTGTATRATLSGPVQRTGAAGSTPLQKQVEGLLLALRAAPAKRRLAIASRVRVFIGEVSQQLGGGVATSASSSSSTSPASSTDASLEYLLGLMGQLEAESGSGSGSSSGSGAGSGSGVSPDLGGGGGSVSPSGGSSSGSQLSAADRAKYTAELNQLVQQLSVAKVQKKLFGDQLKELQSALPYMQNANARAAVLEVMEGLKEELAKLEVTIKNIMKRIQELQLLLMS